MYREHRIPHPDFPDGLQVRHYEALRAATKSSWDRYVNWLRKANSEQRCADRI